MDPLIKRSYGVVSTVVLERHTFTTYLAQRCPTRPKTSGRNPQKPSAWRQQNSTCWREAMRTRSPRADLLKPVRHLHLAVHRRCRRLMPARFFALAHALEELPETSVAVRDERAH